ncbi:MAG: PIN domain-containing protein [Nocardioidaceae bacterium]|nr:PIN domain-containing protein [Nocardioidaceae bacterium]
MGQLDELGDQIGGVRREADDLETVLDRARDGLRAALDSIHRQRSDEEVEGADIFGLFPSALVAPVPAIVVDANVLRKDVLYACRTGRRTTLVNAARAGLFRLFCAGHVASEVLKHHERWSGEGKIDAARFTDVWVRDYAPLLHLIPSPPEGLKTHAEEARLAALRAKDPDDVPSATLALILGAFYLSEDGPATTAVYGERRHNDELRAWKNALSAGGDAGTIALGLQTTVVLVDALRSGLIGIAALTTRGVPVWLKGLLLAGVAGVGGYQLHKLDSSQRRRTVDALKGLAAFGGAVALEYTEAGVKLDRVYAPRPDLSVLMQERGADAALHRATLQILATSRSNWLSAAEIAASPSLLQVAQAEKKVRRLLRAQSSAIEIGRGRWQLGEPLFWPEVAGCS